MDAKCSPSVEFGVKNSAYWFLGSRHRISMHTIPKQYVHHPKTVRTGLHILDWRTCQNRKDIINWYVPVLEGHYKSHQSTINTTCIFTSLPNFAHFYSCKFMYLKYVSLIPPLRNR